LSSAARSCSGRFEAGFEVVLDGGDRHDVELLDQRVEHGEREDDAVVGNGLGELGYIREPFYEGLAFGSETYTE